MNLELKQQILDAIRASETIIISRHRRPDGDAVGSTLGLAQILRLSFPEKRIFLDNEDYADYTAFLGTEGPHPSDSDYKDALVMVLDTGTLDRASNSRASLGRQLIKIDHHIDLRPYGDISWVEDDRSSVCEMIADFWYTFKAELKIDKTAAEFLYTGMVTDSGRFKYKETAPRTLRLAAELLEQGVDTERIFMNLYIDPLEVAKFEADLVSRIKLTENGVAYLWISRQLRKRRGLTLEEASNTVGVMDSIKGSMIWLAFIENDDGTIRVRLRSRFINVQVIASNYHGGGHENASGATLYERSEMELLLKDADNALSVFKANHPDLF